MDTETLRRFPSFVPGVKDSVWWPLYDFRRIDATRERVDFFQMPIGFQVDGVCRTERETNMHVPGHMPHGNDFLATGIRVYFVPDADEHRGRYRQDMQDIKRVLLGGTLRFVVQNRLYAQGAPLARFPSCFPTFSTVDDATFKKLLRKRLLMRVQKHAYYEIVPVYLQQLQHFRVEVSFERHERAKLNAMGQLGVILDGRLIRDAG